MLLRQYGRVESSKTTILTQSKIVKAFLVIQLPYLDQSQTSNSTFAQLESLQIACATHRLSIQFGSNLFQIWREFFQLTR